MRIETVSSDYLLSSEICITFPGMSSLISLLNSNNLNGNWFFSITLASRSLVFSSDRSPIMHSLQLLCQMFFQDLYLTFFDYGSFIFLFTHFLIDFLFSSPNISFSHHKALLLMWTFIISCSFAAFNTSDPDPPSWAVCYS